MKSFSLKSPVLGLLLSLLFNFIVGVSSMPTKLFPRSSNSVFLSLRRHSDVCPAITFNMEYTDALARAQDACNGFVGMYIKIGDPKFQPRDNGRTRGVLVKIDNTKVPAPGWRFDSTWVETCQALIVESLSACTWIRNGQRVAWGGMNAIIPGVGFLDVEVVDICSNLLGGENRGKIRCVPDGI